MWVLRQDDSDYSKEALTLAVGAIGGLAIGLLLSRRGGSERVGRLGSGLKERAQTVARRLRPARMQRLSGEQSVLTRLEDSVLDAFLKDEVLSQRPIDVGAISLGIIELSGSVFSDADADRAVHLANSIPGVRTVVNRLDLDGEHGRYRPRGFAEDQALNHEIGRVGGMGSRRQGLETEPDRPDDSQYREERSLGRADRDQWIDEGYAAKSPRVSERDEVQDAWRTGYDEDELDNQDPHGKHAARTLDKQPREYNSSARVGEGLKPGVEMSLDPPPADAQQGNDQGGGS